MSNKIFFSILVLISGMLVGWFVFNGNPISTKPDQTVDQGIPNLTATPIATSTASLTPTNSPTQGPQIKNSSESGKLVVTYSDTGFTPSPITVSKGETVTFTNGSSRGMWVASDVYPTNQLLPGFDELATVPKKGTYQYTFIKVGTWRYHNQVNPTDSGTVVVK